MQINWTRCSERMPPKSVVVIVKSSVDKAFVCIGSEVYAHKLAFCRLYGTDDMFNSYEYKWTAFTPTVWREVNK